MLGRLDSLLLRGDRPPLSAGACAMVALLAACTGAIYPLGEVTRASSLGVVYLLGVLVIATIWGLWPGIAMSVLSAAAFNFFHLPPVGRFVIADTNNWVALASFLVVAVIASAISELARGRATEAQRRRAEADLTAEMAQLLLERAGVEEALTLIGQRLAAAFELSSAAIVVGEAAPGPRRTAIPVVAGSSWLATLLMPVEVAPATAERLRASVVPALAAVLAAARERQRLVGEAVETEGLRRSEAIKTAVLRAVSHDLRSPVTAMIAAGAAVRAAGLSDRERDDLGAAVEEEGRRLARLIEDLLDLSRLEAHAVAPRLAECSVEEVIDAALALQPSDASFELRIDPGVPDVTADFAQLERAFANLLENARRYTGDVPVVVRARRHGDRVTIRVIDGGPGISAADQERIFEPFYRGPARAGTGHSGSGLGLSIARGFVETNGGRVWVESAPGQGSAFVVELPVARAAEVHT